MKKSILSACLIIGFLITNAQERKLPIDTVVTTQHSVAISGTPISYTAKTGTQPVWDEEGKPIASLHYTYYTRNNVKDRASRP
ncbi:MAG: carboxypeptidase, partial [Maribacter sp.]|nr:carboxypeptidase [Maribacter sp.]